MTRTPTLTRPTTLTAGQTGPDLMPGDAWKDKRGNTWKVVANGAGELRLTHSGLLHTWAGVTQGWGRPTLTQRAGHTRTPALPATVLEPGQVVSHPTMRGDDTPVRIVTIRIHTLSTRRVAEIAYQPLRQDQTFYTYIDILPPDYDPTTGRAADPRPRTTLDLTPWTPTTP
ncbi:hypothetical protein GCM10017673_57630 [Streptosporangium violaceochromogenes]|nr:hypothetical protein GCM10017673_57630 [Streptosporangium violaceochromogenes]